MSATNPSGGRQASTDDDYYAHVNIADDEVIIYNPDVTEEWIQSTSAVAVEEYL